MGEVHTSQTTKEHLKRCPSLPESVSYSNKNLIISILYFWKGKVLAGYSLSN